MCLCSAFNCTTRALARDSKQLHDAVELLQKMARTETLDIYYETFNVIAESCQANGLPQLSEQVLQLRYSTYHSSD